MCVVCLCVFVCVCVCLCVCVCVIVFMSVWFYSRFLIKETCTAVNYSKRKKYNDDNSKQHHIQGERKYFTNKK